MSPRIRIESLYKLSEKEIDDLCGMTDPGAPYKEKLNECFELIKKQEKKLNEYSELIKKQQEEINTLKNGKSAGDDKQEKKPDKPVLQETDSSLFEAAINNGEACIKKYLGKDSIVEEVVIPRYIDGNEVTEIGDNAFEKCYNIKSLIIPDSVTCIGNIAFSWCKSLTSITIPDSLTSIGDWVFSGCSSLTSITIPDRVTSIGNGAFNYCSSLTSITIPDSVRSIGDYAFSNCDKITIHCIEQSYASTYAVENNISVEYIEQEKKQEVVVLPETDSSLFEVAINNGKACIKKFLGKDSDIDEVVIPGHIDGNEVTEIGEKAFNLCSNLSSITIPDSVTNIGNRAFFWCESLESITIPNSVTSIGEGAFLGCSCLDTINVGNSKYYCSVDGVIFDRLKTTLLFCPKEKADCYIPDSVTSIGAGAFFGCICLAGITIPGRVTKIGDDSFYGCESLASIAIPDSVTSIGNSAFSLCSSLTSIIIPDSVTRIGEDVFFGCSSLTGITIPDSVTSIGNCAFNCCSSLTSITIPRRVKSIGAGAFNACSSLTSITIPDSVTSFGERIFDGCKNLTSITIPDSVTSIGDWAFSGCRSLTIHCSRQAYAGKYAAENNIPVEYIKQEKKQETNVLHETDSSLFEVAFNNGKACIKNYLGKDSGIKEIVIPRFIRGNEVIEIGRNAFFEYGDITSVTIPDSVKSISDSAFFFCRNLNSINVGNNNMAYCSVDGVLFDKLKTTLLLCPEGKVSCSIPDSVTSIGDDAFLGCSKLKTINVGNNNKSFCSIEGVLFNKTKSTLLCCPGGKVKCYIPDSVTSIGDSAFFSCDSLTSITIPYSVTSIGDKAFSSCSSLASITIPDSVTSIGDEAFSSCSSLASITIPDSVRSIGNEAFYYCGNMTSITIPNRVRSIGNNAFKHCNCLTIYCSRWSYASTYAKKNNIPVKYI